MLNVFKVSIVLVFMIGCGSSNNTETTDIDTHRVKWDSVPSKYNPSVALQPLTTFGVNRLQLHLISNIRDTKVIYSSQLTPGEGILKLYKVSSGVSYWGSISPNRDDNTLNIQHFGRYQCSIKVTNGEITNLEGGCYVRMEVLLPVESEIEVYYSNQLLTKRFLPMDVGFFLDQIEKATWPKDKFKVIDDFLKSYMTTNKAPSLTTTDLSEVIGEFIKTKNKLHTLEKLHRYIVDRENLNKMIDDSFISFNRKKARKIVGL